MADIGSAFMTLVPKLGSTSGVEAELSSKSAKMSQTFNGAFKKAAVGAAAFTAAAGVAAAATKSAIDSVAAYGDNVDKASQKMGISSEAYQQWSYVLERNGASIDTLQVGMKTLNSRVEKGSEAFDALGVATKSADGSFRSQEEIMSESLRSLAGVEDQVQRTALANELFGKKTAQELAPMLNSGADSIDELMNRAEELGLVMSDDGVKASAAYADAVTDFNGALGGLKNNIVGAILPTVTDMTNEMAGSFGKITEALQDEDKDIVDVVFDVIGDVAKVIVSKIPLILDKGMKLFEGITKAASRKLPEVLPKLVQGLFKIAGKIIEYAPRIVAAGIKLFGALIKSLPKVLPVIIKGAKDLVKKIPPAIKGIIGEFTDAGKHLITGLWSGIKDKFKNWLLGSKIGGLINMLPQKVKEILGIASPSKVFAELGMWSAAGFESGFENRWRKSVNGINGMMSFEAGAPTPVGMARGGVTINLNYTNDADASQMVYDIAAGLRRLNMTGAY